jgi:signal transduction histidine kinase
LAGCHNYILSIKFSSTIPEVNIVDSLPNQEINCLFRESDNNLWVGTYIGLFNIKNGIKKYINLGKAFLIKSINQDNDGNTWVGGTEGLYVIGKDGKLKQGYTENTGLLNHHIYGVLKDDDGNMWYSSNKGLGVFYSKEKKFRFFTKEDGLQANEFNGKAFLKATDGELFFGGINGTNSFYTNEIKNNPYTFPVIITSIKLFDEPYKTDSAYWKVKSLILPYTDNNLSFEFVMPEFTKAPLNQYTFMMEGVDKNWINNGEKRFARYPNLNPGTYTFKVKACNDDGIWGSTITTINIEIVAPFWQHLWFLLLTGIFIVALVVGTVVLIQKQQFKKKMRTIEVQYKIQLERERISRDLHDNVGTQLSLISKSIHGMMQDSANISEEDKKKKLQSTGQSSMEVISALRETIWALNKEEVSIQEFFDKLKSFAQKQSDLNPTTKLEFKEASGNNELLLGPAEALHLFRICQEAITNALKYANATLLKIEMKTTGHKYIISIADNGIGFNKNNINTTMHYGLENMKHRAKEITCNINIAAQANEGTTITITKE